MNEQNLRPCEYKLSQEEAKKGGINSGRARREKRDLKRALEILMEKEYIQKDGRQITGTEALATALFKEAMGGDVKAFVALRDTVGQKPVERVEQVVISDETRAEIEDFINDGEKEENTLQAEDAAS